MAFSELVGQERVVELLRRAISRGNVVHAYLFFGPEGVGKLTCALSFAKALNCLDGDGLDCCERCISCKKIESGNHPDVRVVSPVRRLGGGSGELEYTTVEGRYIIIDQIRELERDARYRPLEGRWKVYIVDEAERMMSAAQNAALKILEEPPKFVVLILVSSNPHALLPTVLSRCQHIKFKLIRGELIKEALVRRFEIKEGEANFLAALSYGRLGWAFKMAGDRKILEVRDKLFGLLYKLPEIAEVEVFRIVEELQGLALELVDSSEDMPGGGGWSERLIRNRMIEILDLMGIWYRDMLIIKVAASDLMVNWDKRDWLVGCGQRYSVAGLEEILGMIAKTKRYINRNANMELALAVLLLRMVSG